MIFKRLAALVAAVFLFLMPAAQAAGIDGQALAGTVPRLLTATSDRNARCAECSMGDAVADAACRYLDADIAIVNGGDLKANLQPGDITWDALRNSFTEDRELATAVVTVSQLREILEAGVSHIRLNEAERIDEAASLYDGFPQISGFTFQYDASALPGERIYSIYVDDERLDPDDTRTFTLAATAFMLDGGYGMPAVDHAEPSGLTLSEVTARYMNDGMDDYLKTGSRIRTMGTTDGIISELPFGVIVLAIVIVSAFGRIGKVRRFNATGYYPGMENHAKRGRDDDWLSR